MIDKIPPYNIPQKIRTSYVFPIAYAWGYLLWYPSQERYFNTKEPFLLRKCGARSVPSTDKQQAIPGIKCALLKSPYVLAGFCHQLTLPMAEMGFFTDIRTMRQW